MSNRIVSDIITIRASNELNGTITVQFIVRKELIIDISVSIQSLILKIELFHLHFLLFRRVVNHTVYSWEVMGNYYYLVTPSNIPYIRE